MKSEKISNWKAVAVAIFVAIGTAAPAARANDTSSLTEDERNTIRVFNSTSPFVVYVHNIQQVVDFMYNAHEVQTGTGSGFIWDDKGHIVTNFHVIQGSTKLSVLVRDGKTVPATIVGADPNKDIAVLKLETTDLLPSIKKNPAIPLAMSENCSLKLNQPLRM